MQRLINWGTDRYDILTESVKSQTGREVKIATFCSRLCLEWKKRGSYREMLSRNIIAAFINCASLFRSEILDFIYSVRSHYRPRP